MVIHKSKKYKISSLSSKAFEYSKIESITFPDDSEVDTFKENFYILPILNIYGKLDKSNFQTLENLIDIEISPENKMFQMTSSNLLAKKSDLNSRIYDHLVYCCRNAEEITIPSHIKVISSGAFYRCVKFHSINFQPNSSLENIDDSSFTFCANLKNIIFPETVKRIGNQSFCYANSLESIQILALNLLHHPCICEALGINIQEKTNDNINKKSKNDKKSKKQEDEYEIEYDESDEEQKNEEKTTIALFIEYLQYKIKNAFELNILNDTLKVRVAVEIAFGKSHIHSQNMIHCDLKIKNIMLNYAYEAKIIDFDLVHISEGSKDINKSLTKGIGTLAYMSPEISNEEKYDNKTDVYSYGIVLYGIFPGRLPKQNLKDNMINKNPIRFPHSSSSMTKYCIQLIKKCIEFNPNDRPSFDEIIEDMKNNSFRLAEEIDVTIINERYSKLAEIRIQNNHH